MRFDPTALASRDPQRMMDLIMRFPLMCEEAWALAPLAGSIKSPQAVVALGMGGSGIGGGIFRAPGWAPGAGPLPSPQQARPRPLVGPPAPVLPRRSSAGAQ